VSIDRSLKVASGNLAKKRSVLTRTERLKKLEEDRGLDFNTKPALGLPKTRVASVSK